jgi:hypothetical protein
MCLGTWSLLGYVNDSDVKAVVVLPELWAGEKEEQLQKDWDKNL